MILSVHPADSKTRAQDGCVLNQNKKRRDEVYHTGAGNRDGKKWSNYPR